MIMMIILGIISRGVEKLFVNAQSTRISHSNVNLAFGFSNSLITNMESLMIIKIYKDEMIIMMMIKAIIPNIKNCISHIAYS